MSESKKILVVDDEAPIRRIIELKLKSRGYDVLSATNGEDGLRLIKSEKPDVVILDINMPRLSGRQLCEMTDSMKKERSFLTIIMTARILHEERQWIGEMHDTLFMEKPFSPTRLLESIDRYCGVQR